MYYKMCRLIFVVIFKFHVFNFNVLIIDYLHSCFLVTLYSLLPMRDQDIFKIFYPT